MIVGLDIATSSGIALYDGEKICVTTFKGTPVELVDYIESIIPQNSTVIIERHVHFLNANTTRSLLERLGYVKYSLIKNGHAVSDLFPGKGRKQLIEAYKSVGYTKDELDAIILINAHLKQMNQPFQNIERF